MRFSILWLNPMEFSRDVKGFEETSIPCYSPTGFLRMIKTGEIIIGED